MELNIKRIDNGYIVSEPNTWNKRATYLSDFTQVINFVSNYNKKETPAVPVANPVSEAAASANQEEIYNKFSTPPAVTKKEN